MSASVCSAAPAPAMIEVRHTMRLGEISDELGFDVTEAFLARLGFFPVAHQRTARLFAKRDFPLICAAIARHALMAMTRAPLWVAL